MGAYAPLLTTAARSDDGPRHWPFLNQDQQREVRKCGHLHFAAGFVEQQLHQAVAFQFSQCLGIGLEIAAHRTKIEALLGGEFPGIDFAQSHRADFRVGEGGCGDAAVIDLAAVAQDVVHRHRALGGRGGPASLARQVTDSPEVRNGPIVDKHTHLVVDGNETTVGFHVHRLRLSPLLGNPDPWPPARHPPRGSPPAHGC